MERCILRRFEEIILGSEDSRSQAPEQECWQERKPMKVEAESGGKWDQRWDMNRSFEGTFLSYTLHCQVLVTSGVWVTQGRIFIKCCEAQMTLPVCCGPGSIRDVPPLTTTITFTPIKDYSRERGAELFHVKTKVWRDRGHLGLVSDELSQWQTKW